MKKLFVLLLTLTIASLAGCSTLLTDSKNVSNQKYHYNKIMVIAKSKDDVMRRIFEDNVVKGLEKQGVHAVSSAAYGLNVKTKMTKEQISQLKEKLKGEGYDGVILTNLIDAKRYTDIIHGSSYSVGYGGGYGRYGGFRGGYMGYSSTYWEPDRVVSGVKFVLQSSLYKIDKDSKGLQWIGRFEVDSRDDMKNIKQKYAEELVEALVKDSIVTSLGTVKK